MRFYDLQETYLRGGVPRTATEAYEILSEAYSELTGMDRWDMDHFDQSRERFDWIHKNYFSRRMKNALVKVAKDTPMVNHNLVEDVFEAVQGVKKDYIVGRPVGPAITWARHNLLSLIRMIGKAVDLPSTSRFRGVTKNDPMSVSTRGVGRSVSGSNR